MSEDNTLGFDLDSEAWAYNLFVIGFSIFFEEFQNFFDFFVQFGQNRERNDWYKW